MSNNAILAADDALTLSQCLMDVIDRIPGITTEQRLIVLGAASVLAEHSCNAVIANAVAARSLDRLARTPAAISTTEIRQPVSSDRGVWRVLMRLLGLRKAAR
jgi:hypothetical protein